MLFIRTGLTLLASSEATKHQLEVSVSFRADHTETRGTEVNPDVLPGTCQWQTPLPPPVKAGSSTAFLAEEMARVKTI